ncbi:MAG: peptidylprolyl isomerase [Verrucomicrobiae bacterium]|nr:peptidylprolyl isomerase [Verrucomicrobiae bacterium]
MLRKGLETWGRFLFVLLVLLAGRGTGWAVDLVDGIAAVVNDEIITYTDLKKLVGQTEETMRKAFAPDDPKLVEKLREARKEALDQLIERRLIIQAFNSRGGKVPDTYVEAEIQQIIEDQYGRDRTLLIKTLEAMGLSLETFKEQVREKQIVRFMRNNEVNREVIVSPYKIEQYYKAHAEEFKEGEKVKLRLIFIKKGGNEQETEGARSLAQELLLKLATGADFTALANVYSEGAEKNNGGELGFVGRDSLRKELADAAFSLNPGQMSKVVETGEGFYIMQVEEKKPSKVTSMEEARDLIERLLIQQQTEELQKRWIQSLRRKAYIRLY